VSEGCCFCTFQRLLFLSFYLLIYFCGTGAKTQGLHFELLQQPFFVKGFFSRYSLSNYLPDLCLLCSQQRPAFLSFFSLQDSERLSSAFRPPDHSCPSELPSNVIDWYKLYSNSARGYLCHWNTVCTLRDMCGGSWCSPLCVCVCVCVCVCLCIYMHMCACWVHAVYMYGHGKSVTH
jgi:hypothetical protein